jgi:hypothetical protein
MRLAILFILLGTTAAFARGGHFYHSDPYAERTFFGAMFLGIGFLALFITAAWQFLKLTPSSRRWRDVPDAESVGVILVKGLGASLAAFALAALSGGTALGGAIFIIVFLALIVVFGRGR